MAAMSIRRNLQDLPAFNTEFAQSAMAEGSAFVPWIGGSLDDILCEQFERTVSADNCVRFDGQIHLGEIPIGRSHARDAGQRQLLRQAPLMGAKGPLRSPSRLGRVGDHLDAQLPHGATKLGRMVFVDLAVRFRGMPIVAAPVL
jgi:hypothetical protein